MRVQSQNFGSARAIRFQMLKKRYIYPTHVHQYAELVIPLEGDIIIRISDRAELLSPGKAAFVHPFQAHSYYSEVVNKLAIFVFSPSMLPDFFKTFDGKVGNRAVFTASESTLDSFATRIYSNPDFDLYDAKGCLYLMLGDYMKQVEPMPGLESDTIAVKVVNYINENITDDITLTSIALAIGYNPNYLSGCIQRIFGMNLRSLIASIRTDKAKYLLWETDKTGLEICFECGFGSERSFHRQFKDNTGKTPKEYRSQYAGGKIMHGTIKYF